jgi:predicted permease
MVAVSQLPAVQYAAVAMTIEAALTGGDTAQYVRGEAVSADYFAVFGLRPVLGRTLAAGDRPGDAAVVLADSLWRKSFGAAPDVIGRTVHLNGVIHTIVGVMPPTFLSLDNSQFWKLLDLRPGELTQSGRGPYYAVARLATADIEVARRQAQGLSQGLLPIDGEAVEVSLTPLADAWVSVPPSTLLTLLGAVSFVLLIACGNVANLLLVRGRRRSTELMIRAALGATQLRLLRHLFTECFVLAVLAAGAGTGLAWLLIRLMLATARPEVARLGDVTVDWRVTVFAIAAAGVSILVFGIGPAIMTVSRPGILANSGRSATPRRGRHASQILIGIEVALTLALLTGSGLVLTRLHALLSVEVGFETRHLHVATLRPTTIDYRARSPFYAAVAAALERDGHEVAVISSMPLGSSIAGPVEVRTGGPDSAPLSARMRVTSAGALTLLKVPILRGRDIAPDDRAGQEEVAVVNAMMAAQLSPTGDPVGSMVTVRTFDRQTRRVRIIGVCADFRDSYFRPARPEIYGSLAQFPSSLAYLLVRGPGPTASVEAAIGQAVEQVDPRQAPAEVVTAGSLGVVQTAYSRFIAMLVSVFAAFALLLAVSGIVSVVGASIAERTRELGLRISLGAAPRQLAVLLLRDIVPAVVLGAIVGLVAAYNLSHLVRVVLTGSSPFDPAAYAAAAVLMIVVAGAAAWYPLRSAYRIDPAVVLRAD